MSLKSGGAFLSFPNNTFVKPQASEDNQENILKRFGNRLKKMRLANNFTQEELAAEAGFSRSYYTEIETGKRNISLLNIQKLAVCLDVEIKDLLDFDNTQNGKI